jgi:hypothetical protein
MMLAPRRHDAGCDTVSFCFIFGTSGTVPFSDAGAAPASCYIRRRMSTAAPRAVKREAEEDWAAKRSGTRAISI